MNGRLFSGELGFTTNIQLVKSVSLDPNVKIIYVGDTLGAENLISYYQMIPGTLLVPEFSVMEADVNGDMQEFVEKYYAQLSNEPAFSYLITLLTAMHRGKNVLIYIPPEAGGLKYPTVLAQFIDERFGIQSAWDNIPFAFKPEYTVYDADMMYSINLLGPYEYISIVPEPSVPALKKLSYDLMCAVDFNDPKQIKNFVIFLLQNKEASVHVNPKIPITRPFGRGMKC